jgi:hypothetical protein
MTGRRSTSASIIWNDSLPARIRVRQWHVDDLDGGGIRLYGSDHPLARQYSSAKARLRLQRVKEPGAAIAVLVKAHTHVFDDWVPIERYLGSLADLPVRVADGLSVTGRSSS